MQLSADIDLILDEATQLRATLLLKIRGTDISFTFLDTQGQAIATDLISQFRTIQISEENSLMTTLNGPFITRCIVFRNERDMGKLYQLLHETASLKPRESDPRTFDLFDNRNEITKFIDKIKQTKTVKHVDGFMYGTIDSILPSMKVSQMSKEAAETCNLIDLNLSAYHFDVACFAVLFERLLGIGDVSEEYEQLKQQWKLTSVNQWNHDFKLRKFVYELDSWIAKSDMDNEHLKVLLFNVCVTLFTHYYGALEFNNQLICILTTLMFSLFTAVTDDEGLEMTTGSKISYKEAESMLFGYLMKLTKLVKDTMKNASTEWKKMSTLLKDVSPSSMSVLEERNINTLDFVQPDNDTFFTRGRSRYDSALLMLCALWVGDISVFRTHIDAIAFILLQEKLQETSKLPREKHEFLNTFLTELPRIPARLLVLNCTKLVLPTKKAQ